MNISAYFSNSGTPATGLSPVINIRDISDGSLVVTAAAMTEVNDGFYKYAFAGYDSSKDYVILCDGGVALAAADRYAITTTGKGEDFSATEKAAITAAVPTTAEIKTEVEQAGSHLALIKAVTDALTVAASSKFALSAGVIVSGTVSYNNTEASPSVFYSDDITEATANHFYGRIVIFTSGALQYQATDIVAYEFVGGEGKFTVTTLTEAPLDNVTFIIV